MNFLDRNTLPKFQERLDLASADLNDEIEIFCKAINELAGRIYVMNNLIPAEERGQYAEEANYLFIDKMNSIDTKVSEINTSLETIKQDIQDFNSKMENRYLELEERLNRLDDAAARKSDLNVVLYRTGELE